MLLTTETGPLFDSFEKADVIITRSKIIRDWY
jgi:hypothetical protein